MSPPPFFYLCVIFYCINLIETKNIHSMYFEFTRSGRVFSTNTKINLVGGRIRPKDFNCMNGIKGGKSNFIDENFKLWRKFDKTTKKTKYNKLEEWESIC